MERRHQSCQCIVVILPSLLSQNQALKKWPGTLFLLKMVSVINSYNYTENNVIVQIKFLTLISYLDAIVISTHGLLPYILCCHYTLAVKII